MTRLEEIEARKQEIRSEVETTEDLEKIEELNQEVDSLDEEVKEINEQEEERKIGEQLEKREVVAEEVSIEEERNIGGNKMETRNKIINNSPLCGKYDEDVDNESAHEVISKKNEEKARAKREKMGISEEKIRNYANMNTRSIQSKAAYNNAATDNEEQLKVASEVKANAKPGSLAAKANLVRDYNERNSRK